MPQKTPHLPDNQLIIADSSPLITLGILDIFNVLPVVADAVWIPATVRDECLILEGAAGAKEIALAITSGIIQVKPDIPENSKIVQVLSLCLDKGQAQAIAMAKATASLLLIDKKNGRVAAKQMGVNITGSLAMLIKAKRAGLLPMIKPAIKHLQACSYRYSEALVSRILTLAGEETD